MSSPATASKAEKRRLAEKPDRMNVLGVQQRELKALLEATSPDIENGARREAVISKMYDIKDSIECVLGEAFALQKARPCKARLHIKSPAEDCSGIRNSNSLFLELPAELRNRVYGFALGGHTIHYRTQWGPDVCVSPIEREEPREGLACRRLELYQAKVHAQCMTRSARLKGQRDVRMRANISIGLLRVCRQVYDEAALIPYASNFFNVDNARHGLRNFTSKLINHQLAAISSITINIRAAYPGNSANMWPLQDLPNLRSLTVLFEKFDLRGVKTVCEKLEHLQRCLPKLQSITLDFFHENDQDIKLVENEAAGLKKALLKSTLGDVAEDNRKAS